MYMIKAKGVAFYIIMGAAFTSHVWGKSAVFPAHHAFGLYEHII